MFAKAQKKKIPFYDPRPTNMRLPNPLGVAQLTSALQAIEDDGLAADDSGRVKMY